VLTPIAADAERGWILLPDGGPSLDGVDGLAAALADYGRLQRELELHVEAMLALGVPDMRPAAMVGRFGEALEAGDGGDPETLRRIAAMAPTVEGWCERLAASPLPPSLDHNDLHPRNVLVDDAGGTRYYDWGDSVIAHPFAAALVPLGMVRRALGDGALECARDAYLDVFSDRGPRAELGELLELACHVAKIARALTWHRALQAAREQGEPVDPEWADAPLQTLAMVLDAHYLGA
jgi:aminoglycoside phosphotransferase (APT) family kinase protein